MFLLICTKNLKEMTATHSNYILKMCFCAILKIAARSSLKRELIKVVE